MRPAAPQFCSLEALGEWHPLLDRQDPISRIEEENRTRLPWLIPERHRRMAETNPCDPSTFSPTMKYTTPSFKSGNGRFSLIMMGTKCVRIRCVK